jgi:hypothetical protein
MLGRHVYRVHREEGSWTVAKDGDTRPVGEFAAREEALAQACKLAGSDQPSRVVVDDGDGVILEEHLFGSDLSQEFENSAQ